MPYPSCSFVLKAWAPLHCGPLRGKLSKKYFTPDRFSRPMWCFKLAAVARGRPMLLSPHTRHIAFARIDRCQPILKKYK